MMLGGLTELRKAIIFMVIIYYSERIQIKFSKGKTHIGQSPGETSISFQLPVPLESFGQCLVFLAVMCSNAKYHQPGKLTRTWMARAFIGSLCACMTDLVTQSPTPPEVKLFQHRPNHTASVNPLAWPKAPGIYTKTLKKLFFQVSPSRDCIVALW
ncbi:hypothetical protein HJG60_010534 [Phyllostomus discolor]|uniref:Uncharacterized protein n=1 Tax=Phyllostomus discolor TaxID=89673 RepID=A0A834AS50_9CHIR|nr:hypothetical protein HJG60_010534 [Phyllostomus discolor]